MNDEYTVKQLKKMLEHEMSDTEPHYGATLSYHSGYAKPIIIDAGGLQALIEYYSTHDKDLDRKPEKVVETKDNTKVSYLYRDASNYKIYTDIVVKGHLTEDQKAEIWKTLPDEESFIPGKVGLPENRFSTTTEDDGPWFELLTIEDTDEKVTETTTAEEMYNGFLSAKEDGWYDPLWSE